MAVSEWSKYIHRIIEQIDGCIKSGDSEALALKTLAGSIGYSEYHTSRMFREISGMTFKDYIRYRKLAFAFKEIRDTQNSILDIAVKYDYSSNEAFSRAFKEAYGINPSEYRAKPVPVVLRTVIKPFDCYLMEGADKSVNCKESKGEVKAYYVKIPAHKFLHIRNYESIGYFDFWEKQSHIPGQDCETICGILDSIKGKLDDVGGSEENAGRGQLMAWINEPEGRICSWGIPLSEAYGVRLPADYCGAVPKPLQIMYVPEGDYIVFEHGPFDFETESQSVEKKIEAAMKDFDYDADGYQLDTTPERVFYFYHDCQRFFKYVRPVCKKQEEPNS